MRNTLMLGTAFALMASTALAAAPAGLTFSLDPAKVAERTGATAGLILASDDDDGRGMLYHLGLLGDDEPSAGSSLDEDEDEDDDDEDEDDEDGDDDDNDDDRDSDGGDSDGGNDNDGGDDD